MDLGLNGKVAIVTGGSGGIGGAISETLAREGARVVVAYFQNEKAAAVIAAEIVREGGSAVVIQVDVRSAPSVQRMFEQADRVMGRIDILVNCAGVAFFRPLSSYSEPGWDVVLDTNLKGTFLCCKAVLPYFQISGGGDIVNISSLAASTGSFEGVAYAASKSGINTLTLSLALELAEDNIRVNGVAPGRIATSFRRTQTGPYFDFMLEQTPLKRMGSAQEIANCVAFISSRASAFVTGETIYVTGGLHAVHLGHIIPDTDSKLL